MSRKEWSDYIDFKGSLFRLDTPAKKCSATLEHCVILNTEPEINSAIARLLADDGDGGGSQLSWERAPASESMEAVGQAAQFLLRDMQNDAVYSSSRGYMQLAANNPTANNVFDTFSHTVLSLKHPVAVRTAALQIDHALQHASATGDYALVHVRRGDKINPKLSASIYVQGLEKSTSAAHVLETLRKVVPAGSAVYIMTNEWDTAYFDLVRVHYKTFTWFQFPHVRAFMHGCPIPNYPHRVMTAEACDSLMVYLIEEELLGLVDPSESCLAPTCVCATTRCGHEESLHMRNLNETAARVAVNAAVVVLNSVRLLVCAGRAIHTFEKDTHYQWRAVNRAPYLHPADGPGSWMPPKRKASCNIDGAECRWDSQCCSGKCDVFLGAATSTPACVMWHPRANRAEEQPA